MLFVHNDCNRPEFNLASEEYLLRSFKKEIIMLWRNKKAVIVGCNQNTFSEIDYNFINKNGISVVRRQTGGGAVFHDMGNINYTYITKNNNSLGDYKTFTKDLRDFLKTLNITAELSGRNDILINGSKFCGNAQSFYKDLIIHHGCIMFDTDISVLSDCLKVKKAKIESKGIKSVSSRVTNITENLDKKITPEEFMLLFENFLKDRYNLEDYYFTKEDLNAINKLVETKYGTWEWNFGSSPDYSFKQFKKFPYGLVEIGMEIVNGNINDIKISGDFFGKNDIKLLEEALKNKKHKKEDILAVLNKINLDDFIKNATNEDFLSVILG